jgi:hypothetical protein
MNDIRMSRSDLSIRLDNCHAMTMFLAEAISLLMEETASFTDKCPVPYGAGQSLRALADSIKAISEEI